MNTKSIATKQTMAVLVCVALMLMSGAVRAQTPTISVLGANPPIPGAGDQNQTNYPNFAQSPPPGGGAFNYYLNADPAPGQTFTTGSNPNGYILSSLALYDADNTGGGFGNESFTLGLYSVSGTTATLITTYTSQNISLPDFNWFQWTNLGAILQPNTQYAYAMWANGSGWMNLGNLSGNLYSPGQVAIVPRAGGTMTFSSTAGWNASFDVGLTPITTPVVSQPVFSPYSVTLPGSTVNASAAVTGPGPYYFQWKTDGGSGGTLTNIPGATSSNLVINTTGFADGNYQYALVVSNNTSSAMGPAGVLTVQQPTGIPGVIAVKFGFTNGYATSDAPFPADNTGAATGQPVPPSNLPLTVVGRWNNLLADVLPPQDNAARAAAINQTWTIAQDTAGNALSGVTLTPGGFNDGWFSGGNECAAGRLLYDFWKFNTSSGQTDGAGKSYATLTVSNLPGNVYDVIVYINDNNGNYWGNLQANSVVAQNGDTVDDGSFGFNGASTDPCGLATPLHTYAGFDGGNAANNCNYVRVRNVATSAGAITITAVIFGGGDMGISGVELVPLPDITLVQDVLPNYAETVAGEQVVFSAGFSNSPPLTLQWLKVSGGATNNVGTGVANATNNGVVTSSLTLNNVQLSDGANYQLKAINANNSSDYAYSSLAQLVVSNTPATANNVLVYDDAQAGANFYPAWTITTNADLIYNSVNDPTGSGNPGTFTAGPGTFSLDGCSANPSVLSDGFLTNLKSGMVACGPSGGAGQSITYYLSTNSSPLGFELTNISIYGGWTDAGRRDQEYEVLYSTVSLPSAFVPLLTTHYLPADPEGSAVANRTKLVPASGVLAHNVVAVRINWNILPQYLNGYAGYSEIEVDGTNSTVVAPTSPILIDDIVPQTASDVVGGQIVMTASFTNASGVQWKQNGTNVNTGAVTVTNSGIEISTLTLSNLQPGNAGNYTAMASNLVGTTGTSTNVVTVSSVPPPVTNVVVSMAVQTEGAEAVFVPTWDSSALALSLLYNISPAASGNGDFTGAFDSDGASGPSVLTDGSFGQLDKKQTGTHSTFCVIGSDSRAGNFVAYSIPNPTNGYNLTNITVYGGWSDSGRDGQAYTISYSTVANTNLFSLAKVDYLPANPNANYCMTRATITAANGVLASNVSALYFDFTTPTSPGGENGFEGYSEIAVFGTPSAPLILAPHLNPIIKSGSNLVVSGTGGYPPNSGYTWLSTTSLTPPIQWVTNSTGILDATGSFSNSLPVNPSAPANFFRLRIP